MSQNRSASRRVRQCAGGGIQASIKGVGEALDKREIQKR